MNEAKLNTIIQNSLLKTSWGVKIPDPQGGRGVQLPFDGFGTLVGLPIYFETKIQKDYSAFSFNRIEEHQRRNLLKIKNTLDIEHLNLVILGIWENRKSFRLFFFDAPSLFKLQDSGVKSIKKVELESFVEKGYYLNIKSEKDTLGKSKQYIQDLHLIKDKIIY